MPKRNCRVVPMSVQTFQVPRLSKLRQNTGDWRVMDNFARLRHRVNHRAMYTSMPQRRRLCIEHSNRSRGWKAMPYQDFRQFLDVLREHGELVDFDRPVDLN